MNEARITPSAAVLHGHLTVTLPVLVASAGCLVAGAFAGSLLGGACAGFVVGWIVWSALIPRWRDWVEIHHVAPADVQRMAVLTGLVWRDGSLVERTEMKRRDGRRGW